MKTRKILSLALVALMLVTAVFSATVTSSASFDSDKIVVSSFSTMTQNYSKPEGWYNDIGFWGQKTNVSTSVDENGALTLTVSAGDYNYYRQVMSNWSGVQPTTQTAYIDITNNSPKAVRVIITVGGYTSPAEADLPKVAAGATKTIELGVLTGGSFNIMFQEQYGGDLSCATPNDFILSPIYTEPFVEETTVTEPPTLPEGIETVYSFASANHNYSKSEGCNPNNGWAWGSFATTTPDYKANGAVSFDLEAVAYNKFRQFQTHWRNVPSETETTYIDITNNSTRTVRVRVSTSGYTTPADANLPQVKPKETITIELGALGGGSFSLMFLDLYSADDILCGENVFELSPIYKMKATTPTYNVYIDGELDTTVEEGTEYTLPELPAGKYYVGNPETTFVVTEDKAFTTATYTYDITIDGVVVATVEYGTEYTLPELDADEYYVETEETTFVVTSNLTFTTAEVEGEESTVATTEDKAAIRLDNDVQGIRFYTTVNLDGLDVAEVGTLIGPADLVGNYLTVEDETEGNAVKVVYDLSQGLYDGKYVVGSIASIKEKNWARDYSARAYVVLTDGTVLYSASTSTRNIAGIADAYVADANGGYAELDSDTQAMVDAWAKAND